jgi:methylated-DNA-[protein]-cysteine S-methyltransferase
MSSQDQPENTIFYASLQTTLFGQLWIAATARGVCCLRFDAEPTHFITALVLRVTDETPPNIIHDPAKVFIYLRAVEEYLKDHTPISPDLPIDTFDLTGFQREILQLVRQVPYGATTTYGELAERVKNPNASRAIGQVLRRNPIPIIIPCHRILSADGTLGGYGGVMGSHRKIALLKHEGVILA